MLAHFPQLSSVSSLFSFCCCLHPFYTNQIALVLGLWAAGMPTIMNPGNHIAVSESTVDPELYAPTVLNASTCFIFVEHFASLLAHVLTHSIHATILFFFPQDLYFFSWLSFAACVGISSSLYREYIDYNPIYSAKIGRWYGLAASSLVVMGSASRALQNTNCDSVDFCRRTKFTIAVGVLGCLLSVLMVYLTQKALTIRAETTITSFNLILFCFGVGYTTFGESPGSTIGNLYFSIWISFILSVVNFASCFRQYVSQSMETSTHQGSEAPAYDDTI